MATKTNKNKKMRKHRKHLPFVFPFLLSKSLSELSDSEEAHEKLENMKVALIHLSFICNSFS